MTNPYGITLDREWSEWAANIGVSPTVAAALLLICQARPPDEIVARLTPRELELEIVGRCPDHSAWNARRSQGAEPNVLTPAIERQHLNRSSA